MPVSIEASYTASGNALAVIRAGRALAVSGNAPAAARAWLVEQYGANDPAIALVERASVLTTSAAIEPPDSFARALADVVLRRSVVGRIEGIAPFTRVGFEDATMRASDEAVGFWIAEAMPVPALQGVDPFVVNQIPVTKIGGLVTFSAEFVKHAGPRADAIIRRCVENALIRRLDASLFDGAGGDASRPPSLVDAASTIPGSGNAGEDVAAALSTLPEEYGAELVLIVSPWTTPALNASGAADASTLNARTGGLLFGFPCVTSTAVPPGAVAWVVPSLVLLSEAGAFVGASDAAVIAADDGDGGIELHSCFQENLTSVRGVLYIGWRKCEPAAAGMVSDVVPAAIRPVAKTKRTPSA
ncbi:phage major capsid protein [Paraburkholderia sp. JPY419]|uniref:phage major capsid family protein n=1 Tax=Paraburkholderia sp. JPY419 TaxID=667660 RepID=UPI003D1E91D1